MYTGDPVGLRFIMVLHWSCRRTRVWKKELRARSIPEKRAGAVGAEEWQ